MVVMEKKGRFSWNKKVCNALIALAVLISMPTLVYSAEATAVNTPVTPKASKLQTIVNKLKPKPRKSKKEETKAPETDIKTLKGNILFTIDDCVNLAKKNDPNLKIYADVQKAQKSLVGQAKSAYFPTLYGGTGYNINNTQFSRGMDGSLNNNYYGADIGINQLIWDFGRTKANINMNKYSYQAAGFDLDFQTALTVYAVKINYTAVLAAKANEDIDELSVRINKLNYDRTKAMYEVGLKSKIDVVNAQSNYTKARVTLLKAQNQYQTSLIELNNAMYYVDAPDYSIKDTETFNFQKNYSVKNEIDVAYNRKHLDDSSVNSEIKDGAILTSEIEKRDIIKTYKFKPFDLSMADSIKTAYENRPDLKSAQLLVKVQQEALKVIKRSFYPSINASGQYSFAGYNDYNSNAVGIYAGINFPNNVNAMNIKYQIEQGKALLDRAVNNADMLKKNIYFAVQTDYVNMKQLEKQIPLMSDEVQQALENFELADGRYAVGLGDYIELQTALTDYNNAQLAFVQAVFNYNKARFYLKKDMGIY